MNVEQDEIELLPGESLQGFQPVNGQRDLDPQVAQHLLGDLAVDLVVFHDEDPSAPDPAAEGLD